MSYSEPSFVDMFRASPGRTFVLSVVPLFVAALLGVNVVVHGSHAQYVAVFVAAMVGYSAVVTRQHLASFRTRALEDRWTE